MADSIIDLRSDTVTQPTPGMREAIARAEVGDDVFGDDPTVNRLEQRVAAMYAMEAAVFVPSGTMANQVAIRSHTEPGHEIICHRASHIYLYEGGGPAALSGCTLQLLDGDRGIFTADDVRRSVRPDDSHCPISRLVVIENTHNLGGGSVWSIENVASVSEAARELGLRMHLDGARIMNACAATGLSPAQYGKHFDSATICFSKGLGAPVGSCIAGSAEFIVRARRFRKLFGGAMRQAGILAVAAEYALDHNVDRLAEDHANAKRLAQKLADCQGLTVTPPETNLVYFTIDPAKRDAAMIVENAEKRSVRLLAESPHRVRAVTHLHISTENTDRAAEVIRSVVDSAPRT